MLSFGTAIIVLAIIVDALAYRAYGLSKVEAAAKKGRSKSTRLQVSIKGVYLSLVSGILMGSFFPLVERGQMPVIPNDPPLTPYFVVFVFSLGVFFSTLIFNLFFMNLPVEGEPVEILEYFQGTLKQHVLGILGGVIWCAGFISNFVAAGVVEGPARVGPAISYGIGQGATMVSALWGLLVWKEFAGASSKVRIMITAMLILFVVGLVMVSMASRFSP
jgi:glucose uptake protein